MTSLIDRLLLGRAGAERSAAVDRRLSAAIRERADVYGSGLEEAHNQLLEATKTLETSARSASVGPPPPDAVLQELLFDEVLACDRCRAKWVVVSGLGKPVISPVLEGTPDGDIWAPLAALSKDGFYSVPEIVIGLRLTWTSSEIPPPRFRAMFAGRP